MGLILINCDLGENESDELTDKLLNSVDAASICCGVHAGSEAKTRETLRVAGEKGVLIGAHPGLAGAGGRGPDLPEPEEFRTIVETQLKKFIAMAESIGVRVSYVKLHGSLYHAIERNAAFADIYLELLQSLGPELGVISRAGGPFQEKARAAGLKVYQEAFADRAYRSDGSLVPRSEPGAILEPLETIERFKIWLEKGMVLTVDNELIAMDADTICVHSDSFDPESLLQQMKHLIG